MGMTLMMRDVMCMSSTVGFTVGWDAKATVITPAVTRMERIDTTETYFSESTAI